MIEIKDVMKSFENKNVLNHLNVTISSGSIFGLIGPNGAQIYRQKLLNS